MTRTHRGVSATVTAVRAAGRYDVVSLVVPQDDRWPSARPGQLIVVPGHPSDGEIFPSVHWLAGCELDPLHGTSIELVLPATRETGSGERLRVLGPLGRGFAAPSQPVSALLVAQGRGAVPMRWLATLLRDRGCAVHVLLCADDPEEHLDLVHLRRYARSVVLARPTDLADTLARMLDDPEVDPAVVYAAAPRAALVLTARAAVPRGRAVRVAALDLDAPLVCGTGLCGGCDLPTTPGRDGSRVAVRTCLEGPVVPGQLLLEAVPR